MTSKVKVNLKGFAYARWVIVTPIPKVPWEGGGITELQIVQLAQEKSFKAHYIWEDYSINTKDFHSCLLCT